MRLVQIRVLVLSVSLFFTSISVTRAEGDKSGVGAGGGGDREALSRFVSLSPPKNLEERYREEFASAGIMGLIELEPLAWMGFEFKGVDKRIRRLDPNQLRAARDILIRLASNPDPTHFILDEKLVNPQTGKPRLAENLPGGIFKLNPIEWKIRLESDYPPNLVAQARRAFAAHEALSQPEIGLESTGDMTFSSVLLKEGDLSKSKKEYDALLAAVFGSQDYSLVYSCDVDLYHLTGGKKVKVWRNPIPIRTYLKWSLGPGHMDTDPKTGTALIANPNYIPGTASRCLSTMLVETGVATEKFGSFNPFSFEKQFNSALKFLYQTPDRKAYFDLCYIMSDPGKDYEGQATFLLRRVRSQDPEAWYTFYYQTPNSVSKRFTYHPARGERINNSLMDKMNKGLVVEGAETQSLVYQDYQFDFSCGRMAQSRTP